MSTVKRAGVIDIGSSSIKLSIGEADGDDIKIIESLKNIVPLGKNTFFKGALPRDTITHAISLLENYKKVLSDYQIDQVKVIATTAVREARNKYLFIDSVFRKTGFTVDVLSVGDIIYYIDVYLAQQLKHKYPIRDRNVMIVELGSGSLDLSIMEKGSTVMNVGLPIGTLRIGQLMNKLDGTLEENYEAIREYIEKEFLYLQRIMPDVRIDDIIVLDENYSNYLPHIMPDVRTDVKFFSLTLRISEKILVHLVGKTTEEIAHEYAIPYEIADTFIPYAILLNLFLHLSVTKAKHLYILETSLAEAILADSLLDFENAQKYDKTHQLISIARFLCQKFNADLAHATYVARFAEELFAGLKHQLGLREEHLIYLLLAAYLHDIGGFIHNRSHHKHAEYIISSLKLFRLTDEEMKVIACIARYHRKAPPNKTHLTYHSLPLDKKIIVEKLGALLRIANSFDRSHKQKVKALDIVINEHDDIILTIQAKQNCLLEKIDFAVKKVFFEEITGSNVTLVIKD